MKLVTYLVEDQLLAQHPALPGACSFHNICPICGKLWSSVIVEGASFIPERRPCKNHEWCDFIPGSILTQLPSAWVGHTSQMITLEHIPRAVLQYEFRVHLTHYEKGLLNGNFNGG